jgi:hypothetical protein
MVAAALILDTFRPLHYHTATMFEQLSLFGISGGSSLWIIADVSTYQTGTEGHPC